MTDNELHYLTYDPDEILAEMMLAYVQAGGDLLYPGDEKEMLLRAVQQVMVQAFAGIDNALRMDTLRYAVRDYLDAYGEKRSCIRLPAVAAEAKVKISLEETGRETTIPAGTPLTADGVALYLTKEAKSLTGIEEEIILDVICSQEGAIGNALTKGTQMQALVPIDGAKTIVCEEGAKGGQDRETDEEYRERIRTYMLASVTTGPKYQYESVAKAVSNQIVDARALQKGAGEVGVYIITKGTGGDEEIIKAVEAALNDETVRPLTDKVTVEKAKEKSYTLKVKYSYDRNTGAQTAISEAAKEYQAWQENTIGRAFNPEMLMAMLYQAGATRVIWDAGSAFNAGEVKYTEIEKNEHCKGQITLNLMEAV